MSRNTQETAATQLRLNLVGKSLVGFNTKRWNAVDADGAVKGRVGSKVGTKLATSTI